MISKNSYCYNNWNKIFKQNDDNYSEAALLWSQGRHDEVQWMIMKINNDKREDAKTKNNIVAIFVVLIQLILL